MQSQQIPNQIKQRKTQERRAFIHRALPGEIFIIGTWVSEVAAKGGLLSLQEGFCKWGFGLVVLLGGRASCRGIGEGRGSGRGRGRRTGQHLWK